ncbi:hypothetical protein VCHC17A1_4033B, partial [Vibrio cholerae HC-17A1]
HDKY